jgi:hypothetical protein
MERDTAKQILILAHRMEKEDILPRLLELSRRFDSFVHYYPEFENSNDLLGDFSLSERELFFLGTSTALGLFDELLIENPNTFRVFETFVYRGKTISQYCKDLNITNPKSMTYLPFIEHAVQNLVSNYHIDIKIDERKPIEIPKAFKDKETLKLFYYLNDNWDYSKAIKYAYIYECMVTEHNYKIVSKTEYEHFVRERYGVKGKFNYHAVSTGNKHYKHLNELLKTFNQNIPKLG